MANPNPNGGGTMGRIGFLINGRPHAIFVGANSGPQTLGRRVVRFIIQDITPGDWPTMRNNLHNLKWVTEHDKPTKEEMMYYHHFKTCAPEAEWPLEDEGKNSWRYLLWQVRGRHSMEAIARGTMRHALEAVQFGWSDWDFVMDFDNQTLATYRLGQWQHTVSFSELCHLGTNYMNRF